MIRELLGLLKTFQRQHIAFNMWKIVKKKKLKCLIVAQKVKNAQFLLKSQESVQECWKCKILLQIQKSAEKVPSTIGKCLLLGTNINIQNTCGGIKIPKYRASASSQDSSHHLTFTKNELSRKSREAVKAHG